MSIKSMMPSNHLILCPLLLLLQSFLASRSFPRSQFFASGGQSIEVSASASVLPMNVQDWFPLGWTGWILQSRDSQESSPTPQFKSNYSSVLSFLYSSSVTSIHDYWRRTGSIQIRKMRNCWKFLNRGRGRNQRFFWCHLLYKIQLCFLWIIPETRSFFF